MHTSITLTYNTYCMEKVKNPIKKYYLIEMIREWEEEEKGEKERKFGGGETERKERREKRRIENLTAIQKPIELIH